MVFNGNKTIYSSRLQNYISLGLEYEPLINTTLNEKFVINPRYNFNDTIKRFPTINVLTIGGDDIVPNSNLNKLNLRASPHSPLDASLFNHIPFYLKKVSEVGNMPPNDNYVLKKHITIDNELYLACYGYYMSDIIYKGDVIMFNNIDTDFVNISKVDTNDGSFLNPVPRERLELVNTPDNYLGTFFKMYFFFSENEILNMLEAFSILYKDDSKNRITELGVCSSIRLEDESDVVWCGVEYFVDTDYDLIDARDKTFLEFYLEVGNSEVIRV
ncbi:MAG: hypothetical protein DRJ64_01635 [Thermoprotei archaeon]|nr:MAG: hypothetical protein DRJ64_01635 [Thermoprotei archaeon]